MADPAQRTIPFPLIVGPTAGGKSALAVEIAMEVARRAESVHAQSASTEVPLPRAGEVVTADAFQVYRHLDVCTAKPTPEERRGVAHHLIDLVEPDDPEAFTLHRWLALAERTIADVRARRNLPIVVGGTHLYAKALLEGLFEGPGADEALRAELRAMDALARRAELERVDPAAAARIHPSDERRTIRALEVFRLTGKPISAHQSQWDREASPRVDARLVVLQWPAEVLSRRINQRVRDMVAAGLVEESRELWKAGRLGSQAGQALGPKQLVPHFEGRQSLADAIEKIKIETRRFAKNQRTWLRRLSTTPGAIVIDATSGEPGAWSQDIVNRIFTTP
ncbi:MAG: tRNA (adenosine(37)-N6)-dimethylallyltransferase MiaA [Phycisphaerales bacterium]|nr:tRNA (adenosine(37)-N6)-dimethylallyltransferase MiaA [Phycisphaerales bacterium]